MPSTATGSLKLTVTASVAPIAYVPLALSDETDRTTGAMCIRMFDPPSESSVFVPGSDRTAGVPAASLIVAPPLVFSDMSSM